MDLSKPRYLEDPIREDLTNKMVFIGGPRQVGKTTLARRIAGNWARTSYFNWDKRTHRQGILREQWPPETQAIVFDEIHKYPRWKTFIKGLWDTRRYGKRIMECKIKNDWNCTALNYYKQKLKSSTSGKAGGLKFTGPSKGPGRILILPGAEPLG